MPQSWLDKYPRAAAMLQGDDDVLDYTPQEDLPEAAPWLDQEALADDLQQYFDRYVAPAIARQIDAEILAAYHDMWERATPVEDGNPSLLATLRRGCT